MCTILEQKQQEFKEHVFLDFVKFTEIPNLDPTFVTMEDVWQVITATALANEQKDAHDAYRQGNRLSATFGDFTTKAAYADYIDHYSLKLTPHQVTQNIILYFRDDNLAKIAQKLNLERFFIIGENHTKGRETYARFFEAFMWFIHKYGSRQDEMNWIRRIIAITERQ